MVGEDGAGDAVQGEGMTTSYFHGGRPGIPRGAFLLPPSITRTKHLSMFGAAGVHRMDRVYVTTQMAAAMLYAAGWPKGVIYQCEPLGALEPDPDCTEPGIAWQCERARVTRIIKPTPREIAMARSVLLSAA